MTTTAPTIVIQRESIVAGGGLDSLQEQASNRSDAETSSLSELAEGTEDHDDPMDFSEAPQSPEEVDTEAETERLEVTPRKAPTGDTGRMRRANEIVERTPSKLARTTAADDAGSLLSSPVLSTADQDDALSFDENNAPRHLDTQSVASDMDSVTGPLSRKRKRQELEMDNDVSISEREEPARKRSGSSKVTTLNEGKDKAAKISDASTQAEIEEDLEPKDGGVDTQPTDAQDNVEQMEDNVETGEEAAEEAQQSSRAPKSRRGKRKGKRVVETTEKEEVPPSPRETDEVEIGQEGEVEEEDNGAIEEQGKSSVCHMLNTKLTSKYSSSKERTSREIVQD
jgi:hypothetical protein